MQLALPPTTAEQLDALYTRYAGTPRTAQAIHQTLRRLFKTAVRYHYATRAPTAEADAPTYKSPERTPPSGAALRVLLDRAEEAGPAVAAWFALACTGMRPGEILGLPRSSLHLDEARVDVVLARETRGRPEEKELKSEKAHRSLPLTRRAVALLRRHLEGRPGAKVVALDAPVFATRGGGALSYRNAYRWWPKLRDAAKLPPGTRPYDCRHAYATELLAEGVPLHEVSWLMGMPRPTSPPTATATASAGATTPPGRRSSARSASPERLFALFFALAANEDGCVTEKRTHLSSETG